MAFVRSSVLLKLAPFKALRMPNQHVRFNAAEGLTPTVTADPSSVFEDLARLDPPRKHYQQYYRTREANDNMRRAS
jgi:hypothetical protein